MASTKPTLFFTLFRCWHVGGFKIMRVTTEKRRQFYGSFVDEDMPTHCNPNQTIGRFETVDAAQSKIDGVKSIRALYEPKLARLRQQMVETEDAQRQRIDRFINDVSRLPGPLDGTSPA